MKKGLLIAVIATGYILASMLLPAKAYTYWIWTPETKKFVNPKYAAKDSPKEQFEWAMEFYNMKDYQKAAQEFEKLTKQYEYSEYASKAQYYVGLSFENMNKFYSAFQNYQKAIDNFPHIENLDEINAREFNIANIYANKPNPKVLGVDIMTSLDRSIEIYKRVVDNAPFGRLADEAQFRMGQVLKKCERYDEAIQAFQKLLDDYPASKYYDKAKFEVADCAYKASLKPAYDIESTDKAIRAFEEFSQTASDDKLAAKADKTVLRLKDRAAEKSFMTAQFYESQGHYKSALVYYNDVLTQFPDGSFAKKSRLKVEEMSAKINKTKPSVDNGGIKKSWIQSVFSKDPKIAKEPNIKKKPGEKKSWSPFSFGKSGNKDIAKKKAWTPFSFNKPAAKEQVSDQDTAADKNLQAKERAE